jgi:hypothetical protein
MHASRRSSLWLNAALLFIGVALIVAPFAISLPSRASAGQKMIDSFHPIMQPASVKQTASYYNDTFVKLRPVAIGGVQAAQESPQLVGALASLLHVSPAQAQQFLGTTFPAMGNLLGSFNQLVPVFQQVPPGLDHYRPLVTTMQANVNNYRQIDSLPNFNLFTWFFVVPGVLVAGLSGAQLVLATRRRKLVAAEVGRQLPSSHALAGPD